MFEMGMELAETAIELFADLSPDNPFFEQLNFMTPEQLEAYPPILGRAKELGFDGVTEADRLMILQLPFEYVEQRNRLRLLDEEFQERILSARKKFHEDLPADMQNRISIYDVAIYNPLNSVQDNILFGRIAHGFSNASDQIREVIRELLIEYKLEDDIFQVGLDFDIGTGGKRLSESYRQRVLLARALLKGSDMLIINRGLNSLDSRAQNRIVKKVLDRARGKDGHKPFGLLWVLTSAEMAGEFDNVMLFERQRLSQMATPKELLENNEMYAALIA